MSTPRTPARPTTPIVEPPEPHISMIDVVDLLDAVAADLAFLGTFLANEVLEQATTEIPHKAWWGYVRVHDRVVDQLQAIREAIERDHLAPRGVGGVQ